MAQGTGHGQTKGKVRRVLPPVATFLTSLNTPLNPSSTATGTPSFIASRNLTLTSTSSMQHAAPDPSPAARNAKWSAISRSIFGGSLRFCPRPGVSRSIGCSVVMGAGFTRHCNATRVTNFLRLRSGQVKVFGSTGTSTSSKDGLEEALLRRLTDMSSSL